MVYYVYLLNCTFPNDIINTKTNASIIGKIKSAMIFYTRERVSESFNKLLYFRNQISIINISK